MIEALVIYFQFFTIIPLRISISDYKEKYKKSFQWFWLFSVIYGLILSLFYFLFRLFLSPSVGWLLVMVADVMLTNGFHHDGLADTCDGLFSGRPEAEQKLEIMKDSRIGSNGTIGLIIYFLLRYLCGRHLLLTRTTLLGEFGVVLSCTNAIRLGLLLSCIHQKHAGKEEGLRTFTGGIATWRIMVSVIALGIFEVFFSGMPGLVSYLLAGLGTCLFLSYVYRSLGGVTGDVCGASGLICEMLYLLFRQAFLGEGLL